MTPRPSPLPGGAQASTLVARSPRPGRLALTTSRRHTLYSLASLIVFVAAWQVISTYLVDPFFLPSPVTVLAGAIELAANGVLVTDIAVSLGRIFAGWLIGSLIAIPFGLVVGASPAAKAVIDPFIHFFRFVPAIALVTLFIVWLGVGETSKVALIVYACGFIVMVNTATGVAAIPEDKLNAARCLGASPRQVFFSVTMPATVPYIYVGMRLAMASAYLVIVAAEIIAANSGLGYLVWSSRLTFRIDWLFAGICVIGIAGFLTDRLWALFGRVALRPYLGQIGRY